jgi:hypothetical protein
VKWKEKRNFKARINKEGKKARGSEGYQYGKRAAIANNLPLFCITII